MAALVSRLDRHLTLQDARIKELARGIQMRARREEIIMAALGLDAMSRKGERGDLGALESSILKIEDYLLKTTGRIETILKILEGHRESLEKIRKLNREETRDFIKMELDIMKNTLTILAMAGIEFDTDLVAGIDELKKKLDEGKVKVNDLRRRKGELDKRFQEEMKRYNLETLYQRKTKIPGYV
jgi:hypothetical protein